MNAVAIEKEKASAMVLKAVIIFDSRPLAVRAITILENAATGVGETLKWNITLWPSGALKRADLLELTAVVAADADLIVLALEKMRNASDELFGWLEHWSERRQIKNAAVAAFCPDESSPAFFNELKRFAEWRGLNFIGSHDVVAPKNVICLGHLLPSEPQIAGGRIFPAATAE